MKAGLRIFVFLLFFSGWVIGMALAFSFNPGLPPAGESFAFKQFILRPSTELSKLVYLIDRLKDAQIKIVYDGHHFDAGFAAKVAKWFLSKYYRDEEARVWVMRWCNTSVPSGKLIWVMDRDGNVRLSREVLFDELGALEEMVRLQEMLNSRR